jgi:cell division protein DivIC
MYLYGAPILGLFFCNYYWLILITMLILGQSFIMQVLKKIIPFVANRYFIACLAFVLWMLFFDQRNFFLQRDRAAELEKLEQAKGYYEKEILTTQDQLNNLQSNPGAVEKYARERYLLKREGEEVYLFEDTFAKSAEQKK